MEPTTHTEPAVGAANGRPAANGAAPTMIALRHVTKRFGSFVAVSDVSLEIEAGEFITLLGPSGCGKTTILRMISGFETPTEGEVILDGKDVTYIPPYKRDVNQVFQSYALFPHLTVRENIGFGLRMKRIAREEAEARVKSTVEMVSLGGMEERMPSQLSGGQRQRVALARAIVNQPKVLLLDEPLSALDAKLRNVMQVELKRLQQRLGITFVFVTHDQEEALTMSDRIAVINKGKIEQLGTVADIYHRPRTTFVANFIGEANIVDAVVLERNGRMLRVRVNDEFDLVADAGDLPREAQTCLVSFRPEKIHLQKSGRQTGSNVFEVDVLEELFQGATDRLLIRTPGGLELMAVVANESAGQEAFHLGDRLYCQLHSDDIIVIWDED